MWSTLSFFIGRSRAFAFSTLGPARRSGGPRCAPLMAATRPGPASDCCSLCARSPSQFPGEPVFSSPALMTSFPARKRPVRASRRTFSDDFIPPSRFPIRVAAGKAILQMDPFVSVNGGTNKACNAATQRWQTGPGPALKDPERTDNNDGDAVARSMRPGVPKAKSLSVAKRP